MKTPTALLGPALIAWLALAGGGGPAPTATARAAEEPRTERIRLACTTFPLWLLTRNLVAGITVLEVDLILPASTGCPHDYEPAPQDIRRAELADALVINGLGLDNAFVAPLRGSRPGHPVIDASRRDKPQWIHSDEQELPEEAVPGQPRAEGWKNAPGADALPTLRPPAARRHGHGEEEWNPHYFASPDEMVLSAQTIAKGLQEHFGKYLSGAQKLMLGDNLARHVKELRELADELRTGIRRLPNRRIIAFHDSLAYFARDLGLMVIGVIESHAGVEPSPAELKRLITLGRTARAGGVFSEPAYAPELAFLVAAGVGVEHGQLDPVASGPVDAPLDYYASVMRGNLAVLEKTLRAVAAPPGQ